MVPRVWDIGVARRDGRMSQLSRDCSRLVMIQCDQIAAQQRNDAMCQHRKWRLLFQSGHFSGPVRNDCRIFGEEKTVLLKIASARTDSIHIVISILVSFD
jgi:hypothetical protein